MISEIGFWYFVWIDVLGNGYELICVNFYKIWFNFGFRVLKGYYFFIKFGEIKNPMQIE